MINNCVRVYLMLSKLDPSSSDEKGVMYVRKRKLGRQRKNCFDDFEFFERFLVSSLYLETSFCSISSPSVEKLECLFPEFKQYQTLVGYV